MVGSYLFVLRRRLRFVISMTVLLATLLFLLIQSRPAQYESQAVIEVGTGAVAEQVIGQPSAYEEPERRVATQADAVTSRPVAQLAAQRLDLDPAQTDLDELVSRISARPRPATDFVDVTGTGPSPQSAQQVTEAFTAAFLEYRRALQRSELERLEQDLLAQREDAEAALAALPAGEDRERDVLTGRIDNAIRLVEAVRLRLSIDQIDVELLSEPSTPDAPSNALSPVFAVVAALVGAALVSLGLAFLIDLLRDGVRTRREVEHLAGAPVAATVPSLRQRSGRRAHHASDARALRLGLAAACRGEVPARTMVIAAPGEADDARDVAALLAESWYDGAVRVLVLADTTDDDALPDALTPAPDGATHTLMGGLVVRESVQPNVWIGPATGADAAAALFDVPAPEVVLEDADRLFDAVLVVVEPSSGVEPHVVQHLFGAAVLVCRLGRTPSRQIRAIVQGLQQAGCSLDAVVLTSTMSRSMRRRDDGRSRPAAATGPDAAMVTGSPAQPALSGPSQLRAGNA